MSEEPIQISHDWRDAFERAMSSVFNWVLDGGEIAPVTAPVPAVQKSTSVELICGVVENFAGTMNDKDFKFLCDLAHRVSRGAIVPQDRTYRSGASCLLAVIHERKRLNKIAARERRNLSPDN